MAVSVGEILDYLIDPGIDYNGTHYQMAGGLRIVWLGEPHNYDNVVFYDKNGLEVTKPPQAVVPLIIATIQAKKDAQAAFLANLINLLQSTEGVTINALTDPQRWVIVGAMLNKMGGLDKASGTVKAFSEWGA